MNRPIPIVIAALALALAPPGLSRAHPDSHHAHPDSHRARAYAYGFDDGDDFEWAVISGSDQSLSGWLDPGTIEDLKDRFGDRFLVLGEKGDRYVVTDEELCERAQRATRGLSEYGKAMGDMVRAKVRLSLSEKVPGERLETLKARRKDLEKAIRSRERDGESTDDLDLELFRVETQLRALRGIQQGFALTADEKDDLSDQIQESKRRLHTEVRRIHREMRDILKEARSRGLAERVDD